MKTKIFGGIAIVAIALAVAFNVNLNMSKTNNASLLALANVEALASEGVSQCDILIYNRNHVPAWEIKTVTAQIKADLSFTAYGKTFTLAKASVVVGRSINFPYCKENTGNCCIKTHVDKAVVYL